MRAAKNKNAAVMRLFILWIVTLLVALRKQAFALKCLWIGGAGPALSNTLLSHLERQFRGVGSGVARNGKVQHVSAGCETGGLEIEDISACRPKDSIKAEIAIRVGVAGI